MKKILALIIALAFPLVLQAGTVKNVGGVLDSAVKNVMGVAGTGVKTAYGGDYNDGDGGATYVLQERWEDGSTDGNEENSWSEAGDATMDEDYTTTALQGSESLAFSGAANGIKSIAFTAMDTGYVAAIVRTTNISGDSRLTIGDSGYAPKLSIRIAYDIMYSYPALGSDVAMSNNQTYYIKVYWNKGTGSNATLTWWYSSNGSSWTQGGTTTESNLTAQISTLSFNKESASNYTFIVDDIRVSADDINY